MIFLKVLLLTASLELGAVQGSMFNYNDLNSAKFTQNELALYTDLQTELAYKGFYAGGGMINYFTPITLTNYDPFQMTFIFNAGYKTGGVQIGFEHSCFHPMQPYATIIGNEIKHKYEGGYNKIFIKMSTK